MPDPYAQIATADPAIVDALVKVLELRAADARQKAMRDAYLSWLDLPQAAQVLEAGCGTGAVCRELALWPKVGSVVGLDPSPVFLAKARELAAGMPNLRFEEGDARVLPYESRAFDAVIFHTCLCHVPGPEKALEEAFRVLRPGGQLAVFDGDYATTTVAIGDHDPLQNCVDAAVAALVHDRWFVRRLPGLAKSAGFRIERFDSHGYVQTAAPDYMLTLVNRGADVLAKSWRIEPALADALKAEGRRRAETGAFFGFIAFASLIARKPIPAD
jgi:ubiquinone/menaquinone biosynthesis C-methylase UbiE